MPLSWKSAVVAFCFFLGQLSYLNNFALLSRPERRLQRPGNSFISWGLRWKLAVVASWFLVEGLQLILYRLCTELAARVAGTKGTRALPYQSNFMWQICRWWSLWSLWSPSPSPSREKRLLGNSSLSSWPLSSARRHKRLEKDLLNRHLQRKKNI